MNTLYTVAPTAYKTIYDIATQPPLNWKGLVLPLGLAVAALLVYVFSPSAGNRWFFMAFAIIAVSVSVIMPYWDHQRMRSKTPLVVEGMVSGYWQKEWTERYDGKSSDHRYEAFEVNGVSFGYFLTVEMAGFHNSGASRFPFRDGMAVKIHYFPERQIDTGKTINRITKLEAKQTD